MARPRITNVRVLRRAYATPWSKVADEPIDRRMLMRIGRAMVRAFASEARRAFEIRGWSLRAPDGSKPIDKSFSFHLSGERTIEVRSSFPHIDALVNGVKPYPMTWLTQEAKDRNPLAYDLTPRERALKMRKNGRTSNGKRLPLVVPLKDKGGNVVFRTAPLTIGDAWIHPGIAKFTFVQRAIRRARREFEAAMREEMARRLREGDPTR